MGNRTLTFGVSGLLFRDGLVMFDRETDTLWTHVDGRAIRGPLASARLELVPAVHATWAEWKRLYPDSVVLRKRGALRSPYEQYSRSGQLGIAGRRNRDNRLPAKERVLGVRTNGHAKAYPLKRVRTARLVNDSVGSVPILLAAPSDTLPVVAYDRRVGDRVLRFTLREGEQASVRDVETGSRWRLADGVAIAGPLAGSRLARAPAHPAFWFGWRGYFPRSAIWEPRWTR